MLYFESSSDVKIEGVRLLSSPGWCLNLCGCEDATISGVKIDSPLHGPNTDGIDIDSCKRVRISDCSIRTGDDAIVLKSIGLPGIDSECSDITVTNCVLTTPCNGFKLGTESVASFENIVFSNSTISNDAANPRHKSLGGIVVESTDGAMVRNILVSNIAMKNVSAPIFIYKGKRGRKAPWLADEAPDGFEPGQMSDMLISNVSATGADITSSITGIPGSPIERLSLSGIHIEYEGGQPEELSLSEPPERPNVYPETTIYGRGAAGGLYIRHAKDISLLGLKLRSAAPDGRAPLILNDVAGADVAGLSVRRPASSQPPALFRNCSDTHLREVRIEDS
jgi:hypothetical protein